MSIANEIIRIKNNISAAYEAAEEKGATLPETENSANLASTIVTIPPQLDQSKITYNLTPSNADRFVAAARTAYAESAGTIVDQYLESGALPVAKSEVLSGGVQLTYFDGKTVNETVSGSYTIKNVSPNGARLSVVGSNDDTTVSRIVKPTGTVRFIDSLAQNARDLGGWPCDGGTVKYGLLYRTAFLSNSDITYKNKSVYLDRLGVLHEFDLRGSDASEPRFFPVGHYHSYSASVQYDQVVTGTGNYDALLKELLTDVMTTTIHREPALFHCSMGCDRTGTLAFYLECILGMSDIDIDIEYELSSLFDDGNSAQTYYYRTRTDQVSGTRWRYLKNKFADFSGSTISARVIEYLFSIGISAGLMNEFRAAMCDGTPSTLVAPTVNVTGSYINCSSSDTAQSAEKYQPYTADITADSGYTLEGASVSITMGGTDITATSYANGEISIANVTGDLFISVTAVADAPAELFDPDTATKDSETNYRLNSSGTAVALASTFNYSVLGAHILVTDYIPVCGTDIVNLLTDHTQDVNSYAGYISVYDLSKSHLKQCSSPNANWSWDALKEEGQFNISGLGNAGVDLSRVAYCRLCIAYNTIGNVSVTKQ